ncbi:MAG TPA: glycosyltransferase family 1 protein [Cytophagaceae bacterium]|jgi:glycosyltransferase involved in cell wall biosynthesis|nr:glycosyltransferase family 1 protein [Cytophagaceae bacterium]
MIIGIYSSQYDPKVGGGYTFENDIINAVYNLSQQGKINHKFILFTHKEKQRTDNDLFTTIIIPKTNKNIFVRLLKLYKRIRFRYFRIGNIENTIEEVTIKKYNPDLLFYPATNYLNIDIPYITTVWDLQHRLQPYFPEVSNNYVWETREEYLSLCLKKAAYIITGNHTNQREINLFYGIPSNRIKLLPHPTPSFAFDKEEGDFKLNLKRLDIEGEYLFYPAQFWPHKNHITLLEAISILNKKYNTHFKLVLTGSDKGNLSHIKNKAKELGITDQVFLIGFVEIEDMISLYRGAFALTYMTFFGPENLPPLESFALGCPVIASRVEGAEEQLAEAAILVESFNAEELASAVINLKNNLDLRNSLIERGYARAKSWTSVEWVNGLVTTFDEFEKIRKCWP